MRGERVWFCVDSKSKQSLSEGLKSAMLVREPTSFITIPSTSVYPGLPVQILSWCDLVKDAMPSHYAPKIEIVGPGP